MIRYKLRTLLIVLAMWLPVLITGCFGNRQPVFVARSDAEIRDLLLRNTPPGTPAEKVMHFVSSIGRDSGDARAWPGLTEIAPLGQRSAGDLVPRRKSR